MPTLPFNVETLLQPLSDSAPSGPDLLYEPLFVALEQAGAGKPERQYGDKLYPAEPPDWPAVYEQALALAASTRDLRIGVWLLRSASRLHGLRGVTAGMQLLSGLLAAQWDTVHPQLDASDNNDPTMRLNSLAPFAANDQVLADVRAAALVPVRGSLTLRELEVGLGQADALPGEAAPTEAGVMQALQGMLSQHPELAQLAAEAHEAAGAMAAMLEDHLGSGQASDLAPLVKLLKMLDKAVASLTKVDSDEAEETQAAEGEGDATSAPGASGGGGRRSGSISTRADALRELERVCEWLERHEPANPAPILLRRAQRLMNKSFVEIIRDLAPDGMAQIQNLAGPDGQT